MSTVATTSPDREGERGAGRPVDRETLALKAATHAYLWAGAVKSHAHMLTLPDLAEAEVDPHTADLISAARQGLALSLVLALRNVLRAAEMACRYANRPEKTNLRAALARFKAAMPGLVEARGTLEHFDDYTDVSAKTTPLYEVRFIRGDGSYVVEIGPARIDIEVALWEARHLSGNAIATAGERWQYPVGNEVRDRGQDGEAG